MVIMNQKPVLFNTEMVKAVLDGIKGCTRRVVKGYIPKDARFGYTAFTPKGCISCRGTFKDGYGEKFFKMPYQKGDILYVRETWSEWTGGYLYRAWMEPFPQPGLFPGIKWHPSIHMPKEAARIWLKVTDVRVERLRDIDIKGLRKEGLTSAAVHVGDMDIALKEWEILWNSTINKSDLDTYGWDANPFVWVIEFERIPMYLNGSVEESTTK